MQNHRYYAVINFKNEKRIFDTSKAYMVYRYKNCNTVNCKGFEDMDSARQYLAEHDYRCFSPIASLDWEHASPVFTEPLEQNVPAHADIYVYTRRNPNTGCGVYGAFITSPQYPEPHMLLGTIPASQVRRGTSNAFDAIIQATRFAYDNGFKSMTVYTTNQFAARWPTGEYMAKCTLSGEYLRAIDDLTENKHVCINFVHLPWKNSNFPEELCLARDVVEAILQQEAS